MISLCRYLTLPIPEGAVLIPVLFSIDTYLPDLLLKTSISNTTQMINFHAQLSCYIALFLRDNWNLHCCNVSLLLLVAPLIFSLPYLYLKTKLTYCLCLPFSKVSKARLSAAAVHGGQLDMLPSDPFRPSLLLWAACKDWIYTCQTMFLLAPPSLSLLTPVSPAALPQKSVPTLYSPAFPLLPLCKHASTLQKCILCAGYFSLAGLFEHKGCPPGYLHPFSP